MNKNDLKNSISLLGPASVGKSLLSEELGKKTGFPVINIDDLIVYINYHSEELLSPNKEDQERYKKDLIADMQLDEKDYINTTPKYINKTNELIDKFLNNYINYLKVLGDLKPLQKHIIEYYNFIEENYNKPELFTIAFNKMILNLLEDISKKIDGPAIFDLPAPFGFSVDKENFTTRSLIKIKSCLKLNLHKFNESIHKFLKSTKSVLLTPGQDFQLRKVENTNPLNETLADNIDGYLYNTDIEITTNGLFNNPRSRVFKRREYFQALETIVKEKLRNEGTIQNMCDEIIERIDELLMGGK